MISEVKCPTRVDFSGGTIDMWPLCSFLGKCYTVNLSIDIFTGCKLKVRQDKRVHIEISDLNFVKEYENFRTFLDSQSDETILVRHLLESLEPEFGFELSTFSQSPVGGGLGGSSSLIVSILKNFLRIQNKELSLYEIVNLAHNIEARILNTPTGTQDYVPAANPGLNVIEYSDQKFAVESLDFDINLFNESMILVYTGRPHHSGLNNWEVYKRAVERDPITLKYLRQISNISTEMVEVCRKKEWAKLPALFDRDFRARVGLSSGFNSPEIESLRKHCMDLGAQALKICGAGGGGCVMIWTPQEIKSKMVTSISRMGYKVLSAKAIAN